MARAQSEAHPVGSFDDVATAFKRLSDCGLDGMAIGLVNYIDEFATLRDEILPRMARLGLREPHPDGGSS